MKKSLLTALVCIPLLTGCITFGEKTKLDVPALVSEEVIVVDQELLTHCSRLPEIPQDAKLEYILTDHSVEVLKLYAVCANRHAAGIKAIKKLANIKE